MRREIIRNLKQEEKDAAEEVMYKTFADMEKRVKRSGSGRKAEEEEDG